VAASERKTKEDPEIRTIALTERDALEASRLLAIIAAGGEPLPAGTGAKANGAGRQALISKASLQFWDRQSRANFFNRAIFSEAVWDILLALYISEGSGRRQTIRKLAGSIGAPLTTTLRWLGYLDKERLILRQADPDDRRNIYVLLTDRGRELLDAYFASLAD
jgi:DNA-binding MarR family transcriptional regulator